MTTFPTKNELKGFIKYFHRWNTNVGYSIITRNGVFCFRVRWLGKPITDHDMNHMCHDASFEHYDYKFVWNPAASVIEPVLYTETIEEFDKRKEKWFKAFYNRNDYLEVESARVAVAAYKDGDTFESLKQAASFVINNDLELKQLAIHPERF